MYGKAITTIIAASIAFGSLLAAPASSLAGSIDLTPGAQSSKNRTQYDDETNTNRIGGGNNDDSHGRLRCEISLAKEKAARYGYRFPEVASVSSRAIVIGGRLNNRWRQIAFANHYGCPVLDR